jgi:hypothetical protein
MTLHGTDYRYGTVSKIESVFMINLGVAKAKYYVVWDEDPREDGPYFESGLELCG